MLKCDLELAYMIKTIGQNCKAAVGKMRSPTNVWIKLKIMFQAMSETAVDAELSALRNISQKIWGLNY